jgi:hypothetical protein
MSTHRRLFLQFVGLCSTLALLALAASASATESKPRLQVAMRSYPTNLVEGSTATANDAREANPQYAITVENVGAGEVSLPATISVTLPSGITVDPSLLPEVKQVEQPEKCEAPAANRVVCTIAQAIPTGRGVSVAVALDVADSVPTPAVAEVEISGGGTSTIADSFTTTIDTSEAQAGFLPGSDGLSGEAVAESGGDADLAGSHPFSVLLEANFTSRVVSPPGGVSFPWPVQPPENIDFELPRGFAVNPSAPRRLCTEHELVSQTEDLIGVLGCPAASQVGDITITTLVSGVSYVKLPLYDMQAPPGSPAELGFNILGTVVHIEGGLDGRFNLTASSSDILARYPVLGLKAYLWGNPADPRHDAERRGRGGCRTEGCGLAPGEANVVPFITMPTACGEPLSLDATAVFWEGGSAAAESALLDVDGGPLTTEDCDALAFEPTIESKATAATGESPSGLEFSIHQPQDESLEGRSTAALKDATVTLPEGMTLNPAAASGLSSCTEEEMGYAPEEGKIGFATSPQTCPAAAKVGTMEVTTPLLEEKQPGSIYVATPYQNPFGSLLAIYLAVEDEETGIVAKLAGKVEPNPVTGQLTATFTENPELPLEDVDLRFFAGEQGVLTTPISCGASTTTSTLTPWSTPEGADAHLTASFEISSSCSASEAAAPKSTSLTAGTATPAAGAYSPFVLRIARPDGSQHITGIETNLPEGLLGKVAGIPYCPESAIAQAQSREATEMGKDEIASPSCPASSEVGTVHVTAGSGEDPIAVSGHAYFAGPYNGAPFSLVIVVPAVAGPFDLGDVVDRVALYVDQHTARVRAVADPLPTIRDGIPLDVRSIEVDLSRPGFTLNPTSCEPMAIEGSVTTEPGQSAPVAARFQVGGCEKLPFKPVFSVSTNADHTRKDGAALDVKVETGAGEANLAKVHVTLPQKLPAELNTLKLACTEQQFAANPAGCPAGAFVGTVVAHTPLLPVPLTGSAIFVSHASAGFPNLDLVLQGDGVTLTLVGDTFINAKGITTSTFATIPDVPVESFELSLPEGEHPALGGNGSFCNKPLYMPTEITGQNGAVVERKTKIAVKGCRPEIRVLGHRVKGSQARIRVSVPSAGKLVASGRGLKRAVKRASKAGTVTIAVSLGGHDLEVVAKHPHQRVNAKVKLSFEPKPKHGKQLHARTKLLLR